MFRQHGALAVELLRPGAAGDSGSTNGLTTLLSAALRQQGLERTPDAEAAVNSFFRTSTPARSRYVSQLLDGTFTFFALSVSDATAEFLRGQLPSTRLFLDTNVVLGMLDLHENPLQEATVELLAFLKKHKLPYHLYVHERTLKELRELVERSSSRLTGRRFTPELSRAVNEWSDRTTRLTGIERRYHIMNAVQPLEPQVFLSKFQHLEELLGEHGVKIYRESLPDLDVNTKGEYIAEFEHFLSERKRKARPYAARDHDIMLWMSLQRQRRRATNALKTGALLLTNDFALFEFDSRFLRRKDPGGVGTAVLPQQLIQVLRPFVGTTADFDSRFVEVFAAPEFRTAQSDYDETASMVVSYLATYEDVSTETAVRVLSDEVLLAQLRPDEQTDEQFRELIENAVFRDNADLLASIEEERRRADAAESARAEQERRAHVAAAEAEQARRDAEALRCAQERAAADDAGRQRRDARVQQTLDAANERADKAEQSLAAERTRGARRRRLQRWIAAPVLGVLGVLLMTSAPEYFEWHAALEHGKRLPILLLAIVAWIGACWLVASSKHWRVVLPLVVGAVIAALTLL